MQLKNFASVYVRLRACICVRSFVSACVCAQKIKRLDTSRRKKPLCPDVSFVQGLSGCTIHTTYIHMANLPAGELFQSVHIFL